MSASGSPQDETGRQAALRQQAGAAPLSCNERESGCRARGLGTGAGYGGGADCPDLCQDDTECQEINDYLSFFVDLCSLPRQTPSLVAHVTLYASATEDGRSPQWIAKQRAIGALPQWVATPTVILAARTHVNGMGGEAWPEGWMLLPQPPRHLPEPMSAGRPFVAGRVSAPGQPLGAASAAPHTRPSPAGGGHMRKLSSA